MNTVVLTGWRINFYPLKDSDEDSEASIFVEYDMRGEGTFYVITFCVHKSFGTQFE